MAQGFTLVGRDEQEFSPTMLQEAVRGAYDRVQAQVTSCASMKIVGGSTQPASPKTSLTSALLSRQCGGGSRAAQINLGQRFLPCGEPACSIDDQHTAAIFCGKFSGDGSMFATASQDASIRLYTTDQLLYLMQVEARRRSRDGITGATSPSSSSSGRGGRGRGGSAASSLCCPIQPYKVIPARDMSWAIVDSDFSRCKRFVAYSSWSNSLHVAAVDKDDEKHNSFPVRRGNDMWRGGFCLFSIQFSDSSDVIAGGANDHGIYIYNLERRKVQSRIAAHEDDVNSVIFAESYSSNILLSGSDDATIKLWDLRSPSQPRGLLVGHGAGVTSIAAKGNGFNFASNAKDQTLKLWDLRVMAEPTRDTVQHAQVLEQWDYRYGAGYRSRRRLAGTGPRERDLALRTFTGHEVSRTLIRCCFSPEATTGGRYICSGSSDGRILMWDLLSDPSSPEDQQIACELSFHSGPVRQMAFHPILPMMVSCSWDRRLGDDEEF